MKLTLQQRDGLESDLHDVSCVLPHEMLGMLYREGRFQQSIVNRFTDVRDFWQHLEMMDPLCVTRLLEANNWQRHMLDFVLPIAWHADGVRVWKRTGEMMVYSWSSVFSKGAALNTKQVFCYVPVARQLPETEVEIIQLISWSMQCMSKGVYPHSDPKGAPWKDEHRKKLGEQTDCRWLQSRLCVLERRPQATASLTQSD